MKTPLFSIITFAYNRFDYTQQSLKTIMEQTYKNLEIIVVNNGATPEITDFLKNAQAVDNRIKIIHFIENQFLEDDLTLIYRVCFTAALNATTGEYIFYLSDDDLLSLDYVEKMVALFQENPECTTAAGLPVRINEAGKMIHPGPRVSNYRPRYMPGHLMALSTLCTDDRYLYPPMFAASGVIFTISRETLVKTGGFHICLEKSHLYGVVPFGVTGFDETAIVYFRQHKGQASVNYNNLGFFGLEGNRALLKDWQIEERWKIFGEDVARYVARKILNNVYVGANFWFAVNFYNFRFKACWRILKGAGTNLHFWLRLPVVLWTQRKQFWYYIKPKLRHMLETHLWLMRLPVLAQLHKRTLR